MKVLQIANDYLGTNLYQLLFRELWNKGIQNEIFVPCKKDDKNNERNLLREGEGRIIVSPCFSTVDRFLYFKKQKHMFNAIIRDFAIDNICITHAHTLFSAGYAAMQLKKEYGIPYLVAVRNVDVNVFFRKMFWLRATGIEVMREAERIVFLSPAYKNYIYNNYIPCTMKDEFLKKCEVIPNGISNIFIKNKGGVKKLQGDSVCLIYAGAIDKNKNLIQTIKAAKILRAMGLKISILCVGNVTEKKCEKWISDDLVIHYPKCTQEKLLQYYRDADIFVMPSHTETFGLVYAEAMSQGLPVIYTRGQGFDGQFEDGEVGYAVDSHNAEEIANRIIDICNNYEEISHRCLCNVEKFKWDAIASRYAQIYEEIGIGKGIKQ